MEKTPPKKERARLFCLVAFVLFFLYIFSIKGVPDDPIEQIGLILMPVAALLMLVTYLRDRAKSRGL